MIVRCDQDATAALTCGKEMNVTTWTKDELRKIAESDDLHISPFRADGKTYGTPTWIWSVVVDDVLYVRAYNGQRSTWYQSAIRQKAGRITAAGMTEEVIFESVDGPANDRIDDAYRAKYKSSPYLNRMIGNRTRSPTVKVTRAAQPEVNEGYLRKGDIDASHNR